MRAGAIVVMAAWLVAGGCADAKESAPDAGETPAFDNLGFEDVGDGGAGVPASWDRHGVSVAADDAEARTGNSSLRIVHSGEPGLSLASQCAGARDLAGRRVTFSAHLKTSPTEQFSADIQLSSTTPDGAERTAALSRTIDTETGQSVSHPDRALVTADDWTRRTVEVDVHDDPDAEVCISVIARGSGTLWADDLEVGGSR